MSISPRFIQDLRDRLTLSEVINRRVKLTRAGREFKGCCPFHREKSPSFYVNDDKQFFHCFGCGAHGDVLGFVMRHDNLAFTEAIETLAQQAGMEVPRPSREDVERAHQEKNLYGLCEAACAWFEAQLHAPANRDVLDYVTGRGIDPDIMNAFRLGFAPAEEQALRTHLKAQGFTDAQMIEAGVLKSSTKGTQPYAFFRDRVIFPVTDARGRVVAFGGRILPDQMRPPSRSNFKPPKYINSADTPLFHKGRVLYAGQHARTAANDQTLIVVEGYMDVIACHQAGFKGAVAPLGTALTEEQIMILWKMIPHDVKEPVLCFDGDEAGYRAATRVADKILPLLKPNQSVRFAFLPEGDDPDTYIRASGVAGFKALIERAMPLVDFIWNHTTAGKIFTTPESRAGLSAILEGYAAKIPDAQLQYYYKQNFRERLRTAFGGNFGPRQKQPAGPAVSLPLPGKTKANTLAPDIMLVCVVNHPHIYSEIEAEFSRLHFVDSGNAELANLIIQIFHDEGPDLEADDLIGHITANGMGKIIHNILSRESLLTHAGFARRGSDPKNVLEGWKSLWNQWDKSFEKDLHVAREALVMAMTPQNEERLLELQRLKRSES
ncbi:MAG: DNA primase [Pseudobdellovibrionaceae bacterium]